jgi:hypothetical protein
MQMSQSALQDKISLFKLTQGAATYGCRVLVVLDASLVPVSTEVVRQNLMERILSLTHTTAAYTFHH